MKYTDIVKLHFKCMPKDLNKRCEVWQCKYCRKDMAFQVSRMVDHLENCKQAPESLKQTLKNDHSRKRKISTTSHKNAMASKNLRLENEEQDGREEVAEEKIVGKASVEINHFLDKMSNADQLHLQKLFAKAIYTSGKESTNLNVLESHSFLIQEIQFYLSLTFIFLLSLKNSKYFLVLRIQIFSNLENIISNHITYFLTGNLLILFYYSGT